MSDFGALSIGLSGLEASRQALDVIGQNVTNANTPGYVQERVDLTAAGGLSRPGLQQSIGSANVGGVRVVGTERLTDDFLQSQTLAQHSTSGSLNAQQSALAQIQQAFPEPSANGLSEKFTKYFNAWDQLAHNPGDAATRTGVLSAGQALARGLNDAAASIASVVTSSFQQLSASVSTVNSLASQIAALNGSIQKATAAGLPAGPLQDQRDALVTTLATQVGIRTRSGDEGSLTVFVGNEALVSGPSSQRLSVSGSGSSTTLTWSADGSALQAGGGIVGGLQTVLTATAPTLSSGLDGVANALSSSVNAAQAAGRTTAGTPGAPFFSGVGAAALTVAISDPAALAAASASSPAPPPGQANLDGSNAQAIAELATAQTTAGAIAPVASYNQLVTSLGGTVASVNSQAETQTAATTAADAAYANATGVSTDAEMARMVQFQNSYSASAKYISTINGTLNSLLSMVN